VPMTLLVAYCEDADAHDGDVSGVVGFVAFIRIVEVLEWDPSWDCTCGCMVGEFELWC
jgi:hypothetical protein